MNIILFGAAGFIGKNLVLKLQKNAEDNIILLDKSKKYFSDIEGNLNKNVVIKEENLDENSNFDRLLDGQDIVYHLLSTTVPITSNQQIPLELKANVLFTVNMLEACVRCGVKKIIFFSSGGTVYGTRAICPVSEEMPTYPICSYGLQKITIEKLLYLYWHIYNLDYRIIRLSNPYGPYQRPNGILGAVTTFTYKAMKGEKITVYGNGSVIRDFIYIDDAVRAISNIVEGEQEYRIFNVGCGYGTSIKKLLELIHSILKKDLNIIFKPERKVDVVENFLDISRYEGVYGKLNPISLQEGIHRMIVFIEKHYSI